MQPDLTRNFYITYNSLMSLGKRELKKGEYEKSEDYFTRSLDLLTSRYPYEKGIMRERFKNKIAAVIFMIAKSNSKRGRYKKALIFFKKSSQLFLECKDYESWANSIYNMYIILEKNNRFDEAIKIILQLKPKLNIMSENIIQLFYYSIGVALYNKTDYQGSKFFLEKSFMFSPANTYIEEHQRTIAERTLSVINTLYSTFIPIGCLETQPGSLC